MLMLVNREELIRELLFEVSNDDLRKLIEYKRTLWATRLEQDMTSIGTVERINDPPPAYETIMNDMKSPTPVQTSNRERESPLEEIELPPAYETIEDMANDNHAQVIICPTP